MQLDPHLLSSVAEWFASGAGFWSLTTIWRLYRRNRYLQEALRRERASSLQKLNEMQRSLLEAFMREPTPTLEELVNRTEEQWSARASAKYSERARDLEMTRPLRK